MRVSVAIILASVAVHALAGEPGAAAAPTIEYVKSLKLRVDWPGSVNREALVILGFDVLANGKVANIKLLDGGYHEKRFVTAAIKALEKSTWQPRRVNGVAVDSLSLRKGFKFAIHEMEPGITAEFRDEAKKVEALLRKGDYAGGEFHARWMLAEKVKLNYEYALLQAELGQTYAFLGRTAEAVRKLTKATERPNMQREFLSLQGKPHANSPSNYLLDKPTVVQLLDMRMRLQASQGLALEAMQSYYELVGLEELPSGHPLSALADLLTAAIRGAGDLRGKIEIGDEGGWRQYLSRRRFTIENVQGDIQSLHIRCEGGWKQLDYVPAGEWTVPDSWGLCAADVGAEPGTQFEFVEFPDAPAA